jgi:hypothetical protein
MVLRQPSPLYKIDIFWMTSGVRITSGLYAREDIDNLTQTWFASSLGHLGISARGVVW